MVNIDRIVPIQSIDFLSLIGTILKMNGTSYTVVKSNTQGDFSLTGTGNAGNILANQPVRSLDFAAGVTAGVVYFVADYDYQGFSVAGTKVTTSGATVQPDGITLYTATLASGAVTIAAITPAAPQ